MSSAAAGRERPYEVRRGLVVAGVHLLRGITASVREALHRHHNRRLAVIEAKAKAKRAGIGSGLQPVCGCTHHLSFHHPQTSACVYEGCRCQQYVGPEPLGHVFPLPLVDPGRLDPGTADPGTADPGLPEQRRFRPHQPHQAPPDRDWETAWPSSAASS